MLYPLKFQPIYKHKIWGGNLLQTLYGRTLPDDRTGEAWEVSCREEDVSVIANGPFSGRSLRELAEEYGAAVCGSAPMENGRFPLLLKYLDVQTDLSVQVHPTPEYIRQYGQPGEEAKVEIWYVLHAEPDAKIICGLRDGITEKELRQAAEQKQLGSCLKEQPVQTGDVLFISPGTVHAACAGLFLFELQQSSDTTFRLYDYDRIDTDGRPRRLDLEKSLRCIRYDAAPELLCLPAFCTADGISRRRLKQCDRFVLDELRLEQAQGAFHTGNEFCILTCIDGQADISTAVLNVTLNRGESALLPAAMGAYTLSGTAALLRSAAVAGSL